MNGFQIMAETLRKNGQERKAELYEFLGGCTDEDINTLFDSSAFNEIAKGYLSRACDELEQEAKVRRRFALLFSEIAAKDVI